MTLPDRQRIEVELPAQLVRQLNRLVDHEKATCSQIVTAAMESYLAAQRRNGLRETLRRGYEEMAELNRTLAEGHWTTLEREAD